MQWDKNLIRFSANELSQSFRRFTEIQKHAQEYSWAVSSRDPRRLQVATKMVSRFWNEFQTSGTIIRRPDQSRPRATTAANDSYLALSAREHRQTTATVFTRDLAAPSRTRISRQTVYRRLADTLYAQNPVVCLLLSTSHKTAHLSWSRTYHSWTYQEWGRVLMSSVSDHKVILDESEENLEPLVLLSFQSKENNSLWGQRNPHLERYHAGQ